MNLLKRWSSALLAVCLIALLTAGCGKTPQQPTYAPLPEAPAQSTQETAPAASSAETETPPAEAPPADAPSAAPEAPAETPEEPEEALPDPDGVYTSKDEVALYIHTYNKLPGNFITKNEAKALGWPGGSLEPYAPGKCIGGDRFGNYEGILPKDHKYTECDIDTLGAKSRGAKRIIFSQDGLIYYTEDHYEHFTLLYGEE